MDITTIILLVIALFVIAMLFAIAITAAWQKMESRPLVNQGPPSPSPWHEEHVPLHATNEEVVFRPVVKPKQAVTPAPVYHTVRAADGTHLQFKPITKITEEDTFTPMIRLKQPIVPPPADHPPQEAKGTRFKPINGGRVEGKLCPVSYLPKETCTCPEHKK